MPKTKEKQSEYGGLLSLVESVQEHAAKARAAGTRLPNRLLMHLRRAARIVRKLELAQANPRKPLPMTDLQKAKLAAVLAKNKAKADKAKGKG